MIGTNWAVPWTSEIDEQTTRAVPSRCAAYTTFRRPVMLVSSELAGAR